MHKEISISDIYKFAGGQVTIKQVSTGKEKVVNVGYSKGKLRMTSHTSNGNIIFYEINEDGTKDNDIKIFINA